MNSLDRDGRLRLIPGRCASSVCVAALWIAAPAVSATVCPGLSTLEGIDVSHNNGTINWTEVASTKAFAFAEAADGTGYIDPTFVQNYFAIRAAGMARGAYQFFEPAQDPIKQATVLLQQINPPLQQGDLPPMLDVEITGGQSAATIAANIQTWVTTVQNAIGRPPIIYVTASFWDSNVQSAAPAGVLLWISNWNVTCPTLPAAWGNWVFWQHAGAGSVNGVSGAVDLDTFNGSVLDLATLITNDRIFADGFAPY